MKRVFLILVIGAAGVLAWIIFQFLSINIHQKPETASVDPTPILQMAKLGTSIILGGESYAYSLARVASASAITLIPNFTQKVDVKTLADANGCQAAVNGGFYDTADKPLGYFYTNNRAFGQQIASRLMNGFFWTDTDGVARISNELPSIAYSFALQTGPLLIFDGQIMPLTIQNDEHARRMVVAKTTNNLIIFLAVYNRDSVFEGPMLADMPKILNLIGAKEHFSIADAVNLDGGTASAFYNGETRLSELIPVGSLFCVK